jgi:hypothetical protein
MFFYYLYKTTCIPEGSAYFGIHRTTNPAWGEDGQPLETLGHGQRLLARVKHYGVDRFKLEVVFASTNYEDVKKRLEGILTPATLADPRCLNMPPEELSKRISDATKDIPKSEAHKAKIAIALDGNQNSLGNVLPESAKQTISEQKKKIKWWHNPNTGEEVQLEIDEEPLTGFTLGRCPKAIKDKFKDAKPAAVPEHIRALQAGY